MQGAAQGRKSRPSCLLRLTRKVGPSRREETHYRDGDKALLSYNVAVGPEVSNPVDASSQPTGNTCLVLNDVYETPAGLEDHWQQAAESFEDFKAFFDLVSRSGGGRGLRSRSTKLPVGLVGVAATSHGLNRLLYVAEAAERSRGRPAAPTLGFKAPRAPRWRALEAAVRDGS